MSQHEKKLSLNFHGRIIEHLGIQMYQSPTAAIAEVVSNCWDADAEKVSIDFNFDGDTKSTWTITITDNGIGMTLNDCQDRYLKVGYSRRATKGEKEKTQLGRPVMGRKGIGKFAGFGIARFIRIQTVSSITSELSEFELDMVQLQKGDTYVSQKELDIPLITHLEKQDKLPRGTKITLRDLKIGRRLSADQFARSLCNRFSFNAAADDFKIFLGGEEIPLELDLSGVEYSFPKDLPQTDIDARKLSIDATGWATESVDQNHQVRWQINFHKDLINQEEFSGVTVFAHKKLAQAPFYFNLTGGTASQAGPEYLSGRVEADWIDELSEDVISTERQRLNWNHSELIEFQVWGQALLRRLLSIWKTKRSEAKLKIVEGRVEGFSERLERLGSEGKVIKGALSKLAQIDKLNIEQFSQMANAMLLAWEGGRLRELIRQIQELPEIDEAGLLAILTEANAITALHTAETVRSKLDAIQGLEIRIKDKKLENKVRDFIAKHPWLISPNWETFAIETRVSGIVSKARQAELIGEDFKGRLDLVLSSGRQLLILEFMRPGLTLDRDHLDRFNAYMDIIVEDVQSNSALGFELVTGYVVADNLGKKSGMSTAIKNMKNQGRFAYSWEALLDNAKHQWREFLDHVKLRAPDDPRVRDFPTNYVE